MNIDWSKAPEGATHYFLDNDTPWRDLSGKNWGWWANGKWNYDNSVCPHIDRTSAGFLARQPDRLVSCPVSLAWDGEGLPPVGTVCEGRVKDGGDWRRCEILAMTNVYVILQDIDVEETPIRHAYWEFRPIRSEREKGVDALCKFITGVAGGNDFHRPFWERAYDKGLRAPSCP